ncbi:MAG: IPTL-CTERM sorting domain-containing protein [Desulfobacterales bacterium]|nr:IPTL-CTERM sorting domain-containing protein [Desulfobacterales bacterium]
MVLHFVDGMRGDDDLVANGIVVDQGGPGAGGQNAGNVSVPTLSEWALALLSILLLAAACLAIRGRKDPV